MASENTLKRWLVASAVTMALAFPLFAQAQGNKDPVAVATGLLDALDARDIQVVDADWQGWKGAFHDDPQVEFRLYPKLNHLGIAGEGDGNLGEYAVPGHVDAGMIADVAAWIGMH